MSLVFLVTHAIFLSVSCFSFYIFSCAFSSLERYDSVSVICKYQLKSAPVTDKGTKESRLNQQDEWNLNFFNSQESSILLIRKVLSNCWSQKQTGFPEAADVTASLLGSRNHYWVGFTRHRLLRHHLYRRWSGWTRKYGFSIWQDDIYYLLKPPFSP